MSNSNEEATNKNLVSASSGGESATWDIGGRKADDRAEGNDNLTNIVNCRVRPYFMGLRLRRVPGWH